MFRDAWKAAGHEREPRVSVSRSIFPIVNDLDRAYFGAEPGAGPGRLHRRRAAIFGRTYAGGARHAGQGARRGRGDRAADTLLLTVPNQLGVDYNAHALDSVLKYVAPELGWR